MKKRLFLIIPLIISLASCKNDNTIEVTNANTTEIVVDSTHIPSFMTQQGYDNILLAIDTVDTFLNSEIEREVAEDRLYDLWQSIHLPSNEEAKEKYKNQLLAGAYIGTLYGDIKNYAPGVSSKEENIKSFRDKLASLVGKELKYE